MRFSRFCLDVLTAAYVLGCERVARKVCLTGASLPFFTGHTLKGRWALFVRRLRYPAMHVV
jgi:hypothetical protein